VSVAQGRVYWVDRSLGGLIVPNALRTAGVSVKTYADLYTDTTLEDRDWIPEVTARGWVILTKDKAIRRDPVEIAALRRASARYVCLSAKGMRGDEQASCLVEHWGTIDSLVASKKAPLIVTVTRTLVQWLDGEHWRTAKPKRKRR